MWRKLFKIFGFEIVMTTDFDGDIRYRFAIRYKNKLICKAISRKIILNPDGSITDPKGEICRYVKCWKYI